MEPLKPRLIGVVAILALLAFLPGLGAYGMLDPTDSFFIEAAREMIERNHYITPIFNYADWLDKPALPFLLIVGCYKIFGMSAWVARLPSALSAVLLVTYTYLTSVRFLGQRSAFFSAIILCGTPIFAVVGHLALSDEPLALFFGVAMLSFAQAMILSGKDDGGRSRALIGYVSLALALICKGPIGLVLATGIGGIYLFVTSTSLHHFLQVMRRLYVLEGMAILLFVCLPYYMLAHVTTNGAFTQSFFLRQNLGRFAGTLNHQEPLWFYVPIVLGGLFPWTALMLTSGSWLKSLFAHCKNASRRQSFLIFCVIWVVFVLVLFTAIPTKLPTYIVPMAPASAIICGAYLNHLARAGKPNSFWITFAFLLGSIVISPLILKAVAGKTTAASFSLVLGMALLVCGLVCYSFLLIRGRIKQAAVALVAIPYLGVAVLTPLLFVEFYQSHQVGLTQLIEIARAKKGNLATLFSTIPSAPFLFERRIEILNSVDEIEAFARTQGTPHLLLATGNCFSIKELRAEEHTVARAGKWYLISLDDYLRENGNNLSSHH